MKQGGPRQPGGGRKVPGPRHADRGRERQADRFAPKRGGPRRAAGSSSSTRKSAEPRQPKPLGHVAPGGERPFTKSLRPPPSQDRATVKRRQSGNESSTDVLGEPTKVETVAVTADEAGMRVDRFLEARFPGLSFSHIQRVIRKGELRVDGKRVDGKDRLAAGQAVRIPPVRIDAPKGRDYRSGTEDPRFPQVDHPVRGR